MFGSLTLKLNETKTEFICKRYKCKCKKVKWQTPKRRKASSRNQTGRFFRNAKIDAGNNRENNKPEAWKLQAQTQCMGQSQRGLIKRELELKDMLNSEKMNIMFLVETDTKLPNGKSDYKIEGCATVLQKTNQ